MSNKEIIIAIDAAGGEYAPREIVRGAIKAAQEAAEAAKKAAQGAAEASIRVFREALSGTGDMSKLIRETAGMTLQQAVDKAEELGSETEEGAAASIRIIEEAISRSEQKGSKDKPQGKEVKKKIESRLDFLARMYAADKEKEEEETQEEEKEEN